MKQILELIENADPTDTEALDKIDVLVTEYIGVSGCLDKYGNPCSWEDQKSFLKKHGVNPGIPYTRSRDALKTIRPEGVQFSMLHSPPINGFQCCVAFSDGATLRKEFHSPWRRSVDGKPNYDIDGFTEELAELHAIIQAIAHERGDR